MTIKALYAAGERLIASALSAGATGASSRLSEGESASVTVREAILDDVSVSSDRSAHLRVLVGKREASVSSASLLPEDLDRLATEAVAMAKVSAENPYIGLAGPDLWPADPKKLPRLIRSLERDDGATLSSLETLRSGALALDALARRHRGVARSEGASRSHSTDTVVRMNSLGFRTAAHTSWYGKGVGVIAEDGAVMHSGSDHHGAYFLGDLRSDEECARLAGERATGLLGAAPIATNVMPVVLDNRMSPFILRMLWRAIHAESVYRKSTFLLDDLGRLIFAPSVMVVDDPHVRRGEGSRLYDSECVGLTRRMIIESGVLTTRVAGIESGAKIGMPSTGHASGPSNLTLFPGTLPPEALLRDVGNGLLVTGLMGHDANIATGRFSLGAEGYLIESGVPTRPVNKVTIAGNLRDVFRELYPASDLSSSGSVRAPTCFVGNLTVGGK